MKYYHFDHLGDVTLTTGADAQSVALMPGLENTGLRLYGQRLYDGELGRFLMPDTIIPNLYEPQSMNPYSYCHNDPVNYIDPSGHYRRVPRIFPYGEMPSPGTNMLVGGLQIASAIVGTLVSVGLGGNFAIGLGASMVFDIAINALVPAILAKDRDTLTRTDILTRLGVDILTHSLAAAGGLFVQNWTVRMFRGRGMQGIGKRSISLLLANGTMVAGGLWSNQLGGLMKSFGMGYNLGMAVHQSRVYQRRQHRAQNDRIDNNPLGQDDLFQGNATLDTHQKGWWGRLSQGAAAARDYVMARSGGQEGDVEQGHDARTPLLQQGTTFTQTKTYGQQKE